jgi:hypothetical protein
MPKFHPLKNVREIITQGMATTLTLKGATSHAELSLQICRLKSEVTRRASPYFAKGAAPQGAAEKSRSSVAETPFARPQQKKSFFRKWER